MDRRAFCKVGGGAVALLATSTVARKAYGQGPSGNSVYGSSNTISALASGNMIQQTASATDWNAYRNTLITIANDWQANNYDAQLQSHYAALSPSNCKSSNLDQAQALQAVQATHPAVTLAQLQHGWSVYDGLDSNSVQSVIGALQSNGMLPYLTQAMQQAAKYAQLAGAQTASRLTGIMQQDGLLNPALRPPPPPTGGGGGGYCNSASFAVDFIGLAFLTIGIMSGFGAIAEGAAWGGIAAWGGGATTVYGVANRWLC